MLPPNPKCSEFIDIWPNRYLKYADFDFNVKNDFYEIFTSCQVKLTSRLNCSEIHA